MGPKGRADEISSRTSRSTVSLRRAHAIKACSSCGHLIKRANGEATNLAVGTNRFFAQSSLSLSQKYQRLRCMLRSRRGNINCIHAAPRRHRSQVGKGLAATNRRTLGWGRRISQRINPYFAANTAARSGVREYTAASSNPSRCWAAS